MLKALSAQRGFSLIEVLVALVVLSIGMMGIASMQVVGLQFNQQALTTTRAVEMAGDMADRIRASNDAGRVRDAFENGGVLNPVSSFNATDFEAAGDAPAPACSDTSASTIAAVDACTPAQQAAYEIWQWRTALESATGSGLADGAGSITHNFDATRRISTYIIDVRWADRGDETHYVLELRL